MLVQANGEVFVHTPGKSVPLHCVEREPVWVSLAEAQAYCKWAGGRVMSEEEYERAAEHTRYSERLVLMWMCSNCQHDDACCVSATIRW